MAKHQATYPADTVQSLAPGQETLESSGAELAPSGLREPWVKATDLERRLGLPPHTLYKAVERHGCPHYRIGKAIWFVESEVLAWCRRNRTLTDTRGRG